MDWKVGIICAGDTELEPFLECIQNTVTTEKAMLTFYAGTIHAVPVTALYSGVCKVNAAIAAQILIGSYGVNCIISAGTAGGIHEDVELFDTIVATQSAYHDVADDILTEFHPWLASNYFDSNDRLLQAARRVAEGGTLSHPILFGKMVTGEAFIEEKERAFLEEKYAPLSVDMETASIAHVCYANEIPFISIRTITDTASHSGIGNFELNCRKASAISKDVVLETLKELRCITSIEGAACIN